MNAVRRLLGYTPSYSSSTKRDLFRHTSGRWLYNEEKQKSIRFVQFDVEALQQEAARAAKAQYCVDMQKLAEGAYNKVFLLKFNNGKEAIAKIPTRLVPAHFVTASEAATMDYARSILGIPVPRILTWNSREDNPVGSEYIIMERCPGLEIHYLRQDSTLKAVMTIDVVKSMITFESMFGENEFSGIGGIYYKEDLPPRLQSTPLLVGGEAEIVRRANERFGVGPSPEWGIWRGERAVIDGVERGPWQDPASYFQARIRLEQRWLRTYAREHTYPAAFATVRSPSIEEHIDVLEQLHSMIPHLIPPDHIAKPVLWHTDLHDGNVLLDDESSHISGILDWQYMMVGPLFQQARLADCFTYQGGMVNVLPGLTFPRLKGEYEDLEVGTEGFEKGQRELQQAAIWKAYEYLIPKQSIDHFNVREYEFAQPLLKATSWATQTWTSGLHHLRYHMYELVSRWDEAARDGAPIPPNVDVEALRRANEDFPRLLRHDINVMRLQDQLGVGQDASVPNEIYGEVKARSDKAAKEWDEEEMGGPYPYQEGAPSWFVGL